MKDRDSDQGPAPAVLSSEDLRLSAYEYSLPKERIARYPLAVRDQSRMLVLDRQTGRRDHRRFYELPDLLEPGDLVVLNNTQVLPTRLLGHREGFTGKVEVLLLYPSETDPWRWSALLKPGKKLRPGTRVLLPGTESVIEILPVKEGEGEGRGQVRIHLADEPSVEALMQKAGRIPLPPYLSREAEPADRQTYQTVFAKVPGAQAAPTAGLHFTPEILARLHEKGIRTTELTLSVSSGTFRGVDAEDVTRHRMDPEQYALSAETVGALKETCARGGRIVAIGTTVAKTLETVAQKYSGQLQADSDWSRLFIYPGFRFQVVDVLLTNFHLPRTTLLMLVSAFADRNLILATYREAITQEYRFFSYGDCMLIR